MTPDEKYAYARQFPVHVGVDTSKTFHVLVARGPDGRRSKAFRTDVSREGFEHSDRHLTTLFPDVPRERMLVGLEFAGHHGFTFAHDLARRGYPVTTFPHSGPSVWSSGGHNPKGSEYVTGSPSANPYTLSPPATPFGSSCVK